VQVGYPRYHFLLIAPNLGAEWLFDAARRYWDRFRPTVVSDVRLIILIPSFESIAVTLIARRDTLPTLGVDLARLAPTAYTDPVPADSFEATRAELNRRAELNSPFGADVLPPGATLAPLPTPVIIPTPRLPNGLITQTPEPTLIATSTPIIIVTPEGGIGEGAPLPLTPTRGPITGG
jgi:hypothetical protein